MTAYEPTVWADNDVITKEKMNKLETGLQEATTAGTAVAVIETPESTDVATCANKINDLIGVLKTKGIIS